MLSATSANLGAFKAREDVVGISRSVEGLIKRRDVRVVDLVRFTLDETDRKDTLAVQSRRTWRLKRVFTFRERA
jgi:hypothetical protein